MKVLPIILSLVWAGVARAQEPIAPEKLEKVVERLVERASDQENLPLPIKANTEKAVGMTIKDYGSVAIPARGLSKESLSKVGKEILPVGQLWLTKLVPMAEGKPLPNEKLRALKVSIKNKEHTVQLLLLGLRKKTDEKLELVVFAKGKEPVLRLPLNKTGRSQEMPVELDMRRGTDSFGIVDIQVLGQLEANLPVAEFQP